MKNPIVLPLLAVSLLVSGCCGPAYTAKGRARTSVASSTLATPLNVAGPVNVSGPVTVTGPVSVQSSTTAKPASAPSPVLATAPRPTQVAPAAAKTVTTADGAADLELKTEDLAVRRATVSNGSVRIRKTIVSEEKSIPVSLRREEYVVERVAASGEPTTSFGEGEAVVTIPLTRETAEAVITPRVIEVLRVRKTVETDTKNITGTVRTEKVEVVREP